MSYRETLLQNVNAKVYWWEWSKNEDDEDTVDYGLDTDFAKVLNPGDGISVDSSNPLCPKFMFEEKERERLMRLFRRNLVTKLIGRQPSYGFMIKKLKQIWARKGNIDIFYLENDFYLVTFQNNDDYMEALTGGPWVISDAYLSVARWRPEFNPKNERIDSVVAWVRFPDLPAPLFDKKFLMNLGNSIGRAIRLDIHTAQRARGKFARMCVELDLTKPLVPEFNVEGEVLSVVYESLGMLCNKCGRELAMPRRQPRNVFPVQNQTLGSRFSVLNESAGDGGRGLGNVGVKDGGFRFEGVPIAGPSRGARKGPEKSGNLGKLNKRAERARERNLGRVEQEGKAFKEGRRRHVLAESNKGNSMSFANGNQQVWGTYEVVPESSLDRYEGKKVDMNDNENLHPGDHIGSVKIMPNRDRIDVKDDLIERSVWNCRGAASKGVAAVIRDMKVRYKLNLEVTLEPRISGVQATKVIRNWGFKYSVRKEAEGFSGGIWILWELE
ncbi:hypothetical protein K1719_010495 [Acacia pycnantha]|nr:hypothetical protein K1719_010495 [Acacia pycnantha]